jgi:signal transduction histidine kinase
MAGPWLPRRLRRNYPAKLFLAFAVVALFVTTVSAALFFETDAMLERETTRELQSTADIEAGSIDEWFEQKRLQTRGVAESAALRDGNDSAAVQYLWAVVERDDDLRAAYFVDTTNDTVVAAIGSARITSSDGVLAQSGQGDFTRRAPSGTDVVVSDPFRPYPKSAPVILLSAGVPDRESRSVVTVVSLGSLADSQAHELDEARLQVVDGGGTVVMAENESRILRPTRLADHPTGESGFVTTTRAGQSVAMGYATMAHGNWTVMAVTPTERAFALRTAVLKGLVWIFATITVGFGAVAYLVTRTTIRPVRDLAEQATRLKSGLLDDPVETDRVDEFGDLYEAVDEMRASLHRQIERAEDARRESERLRQHLEQEAQRFSVAMAACASGELDRRLDPSSDDDAMRRIAESFNGMMDDVQDQNEQLEAFTSIISHDLRNPLTVAKGRAGLLDDDAVAPEHTEPLMDALDRMERIIEDGLTLARGTAVDETERVALGHRTGRAWRHIDSREAALVVPVDGVVRADPNLLEQLFENLFRNAVEHGGEDVTVTVAAREAGFVVADDGPGLPADRVDGVFDPGVSDGSGGTGLGLTIVRRIAEAHDWTVRAGNDDGAWFEFVTAADQDETDTDTDDVPPASDAAPFADGAGPATHDVPTDDT